VSLPVKAFLIGLVVSLTAGLLIILVVGPTLGLSANFGHDAHDGYLELARSLIRGHGYVFDEGGPPALNRPPLVPLLFSPVTLLPDSWVRPGVILIQSLMVGLTCACISRLALNCLGLRTAWLAVILTVSYPWLWWHVKNPMNIVTEMLALTVLLLLLASRLWPATNADMASPPSHRWWTDAVLLAVAAAAAIMTHGTMLVAMIVLLGLVALRNFMRQNRRTAATSLVALGLALVMISPWTYRNWVVAHRFLPVVGSASVAYFAENDHWKHIDLPADQAEVTFGIEKNGNQKTWRFGRLHGLPFDSIRFSGFVDPDVEARVNHEVIADIECHPAAFARKVALNAIEFYFPIIHRMLGYSDGDGGRLPRLQMIQTIGSSLWHLTLLTLAVVGLVREHHQRKRSVMVLLAVTIVICVTPYLPFGVSLSIPQYSLPTIPALSLLAANGLLLCVGKGRSAGIRGVRTLDCEQFQPPC
jgi:hypothetical protein